MTLLLKGSKVSQAKWVIYLEVSQIASFIRDEDLQSIRDKYKVPNFFILRSIKPQERACILLDYIVSTKSFWSFGLVSLYITLSRMHNGWCTLIGLTMITKISSHT